MARRDSTMKLIMSTALCGFMLTMGLKVWAAESRMPIGSLLVNLTALIAK